MAKVVRSRLRRNGKVVEDTTQRKMSFYLKKNDVVTTNVVNSNNCKVPKLISQDLKTVSCSKSQVNSESVCFDDNVERTSPNSEAEVSTALSTNELLEPDGFDSDVTEIPPTPVTNDHSVNVTVPSVYKFKRSLFGNSNFEISTEDVKSNKEDCIENKSKKLKLSRALRQLNASPIKANPFKVSFSGDKKNSLFTKLVDKNDLNDSCESRTLPSVKFEKCLEPVRQENDSESHKIEEVISYFQSNVSNSGSKTAQYSRNTNKSELSNVQSELEENLPLTDITAKSVPQNNRLIEDLAFKPKYTSLRTSPSKCHLESYNVNERLTNVSLSQMQNIVPASHCRSTEDECEQTKLRNDDLDWDEDLDIDFGSAFNTTPKKVPNSVPKIDSSNFIVDCIQKQKDGMHLTLLTPCDSYTRYCFLKGFWQETLIEIGDRVTVISQFDDSGVSVIDNDKGFITVNNDILISSTAITSTMFCMRKAVLAERFRGWDPGNQVMLIGNMVHELFQRVAQTEVDHLDELKTELSKVLQSTSYLHEIYGLGVSETLIQNQTSAYLPSIFQWIKQYQSVNPTPLCKDSNGLRDEVSAQVLNVRDIEDNIWCPKYGIKGKVDLTVEVTLHKRKRKETKIMPLELKTGKSCFSDEHQGQVILYSLMMGDRLEDAGGGLLLYLSEGPKMKFIETSHSKERGLVQLRNELSYYFKHLRKESSKTCVLPEPISRPKFCQNCPFLLPCSISEKVFEQEISRSQERSKLTKEATAHLSVEHIGYFSKWYELLQLEFQNQHKKGQGIGFWNENSSIREDIGTCLSNLKLQNSSSEKVGNHFVHKFCKDDLSELTNTGICVGDFVVVSSVNKAQIAITMGTVTSLSTTMVTVSLDKDLYKRNTLNGVTEVFRLDLNYSTAAFDTSFRNLLKLMNNNTDSDKLRKCIIDKVEPTFRKGLKRELADKLKPFLKVLNVAQQRAVLKLLMAENYILLQGMPGTGKTASIVALVRVLVALGFSVLLSSYTNSAVDNILLRLCKFDCKFVRLGRVDKIHPGVKNYSHDHLTQNMTSVSELSTFYNSVPIVATTCLGMGHPVFKQRSFDYCIIDEASQIPQMACIGPLFHCKTFVLVGDSKQLPPIASSKKAKQMGFCDSLFTRLESPVCTLELNIQYRMNSEIMKLANDLTYNGKLECGSKEVANATIQPHLTHSKVFEDWRDHVLSNELLHSVVFLDTDLTQSTEVLDSNSLSNSTEIEIVNFISNRFTELGVQANDIGVISFYKRQVQLLKQTLGPLNVEVNTVDQYQGRDKSIIIVSCVRNSEGAASSEILSDERRLNVAITRSRHKLIIVGSLKTLQKYLPFSRLFKCLQSEQILTVKEHSFLQTA